jgi:hypothetical protein
MAALYPMRPATSYTTPWDTIALHRHAAVQAAKLKPILTFETVVGIGNASVRGGWAWQAVRRD